MEELCWRSLDLRVIVVFRTEYYGQFNNFFTIPPTTSISSAALPRSGVAQYYLEPISELPKVTNIILLPTSEKLFDGFKPTNPREKYLFQFAPGLAKIIAKDILDLSGETSTLPILQVVCKSLYDGCRGKEEKLIELIDYEVIGRASGALEYHIDFAIRKALNDVKQKELSDSEIDRWRIVLCKLAGQQQVGTITSLILSEQKLIDAAIAKNVETTAKPMLRALSEQSSPILRLLQQSDEKEPMYTLGHDCLAGALSRWFDQHGARVKAEEENAKSVRKAIQENVKRERLMRLRYQKRIWTGATAGAIGFMAAVMMGTAWFYVRLNAQQAAISSLTSAAKHSTRLRDQLLMLTEASRRSEAVPLKYWIGESAKEADTELKEALLSAPIFGGTFPAALDPDGRRIAYFLYPTKDGKNGTVVTAALPSGMSDAAPPEPADNPVGVEVSLDGIADAGGQNLPRPPPAIGFLQLSSDDGAGFQPAIVVSPGNLVSGDNSRTRWRKFCRACAH